MNFEDIRKQVLDAALTANKLGLIHGTSGNISIRDKNRDVIAITPSSIPYDDLSPEDITVIDLNGNIVEGKYKPSSETPMHTAVFRARPDIMAVVHTHSLFATIMSMKMENLKAATVPSNMYYPIPTAPFQMPGSDELARVVVDSLGDDGDVTLLKNHGLLATGNSINAAMTCAIYTEECAQVGYYAEIAGFTDYIPLEASLAIRKTAKAGKAV